MADLDIEQMKRRHKLIFEKKNPLIIAIDKEFGEYYWNNDFIYEPNEKDLLRMFDIVNEIMFENSIPKTDIIITHKNYDGIFGSYCNSYLDTETGKVCKLEKPFITIISWGKDNFSNVLDILCHEMIHAYDSNFGPAKKHEDEVMKLIDEKQYLGDYAVHGDYFLSWVNRFSAMEVVVSIHAKKNNKYYLNRNEVMKDNELNEQKKKMTYEEQCKHMEMIAKRYFDSLQSEEYVGVTVDGNKMYVVIS